MRKRPRDSWEGNLGDSATRSSVFSIVGPLITSYLTTCPPPFCGGPCRGPRDTRWQWKSTLYPKNKPSFCTCNGQGICLNTLDLGPMRSLRCTCSADCLKKPEEQAEQWTTQAWIVVRFLSAHPKFQMPAGTHGGS